MGGGGEADLFSHPTVGMQGCVVGGGCSYKIFDPLPDGQLTQITSYSTSGP
jgi:hypothetical protein